MDLQDLKSGQTYAFRTKDWVSPADDFVPGETKVRTFVEVQHLGAKDLPKTPFVKVARADGSTHLIAVETLEGVTPA